MEFHSTESGLEGQTSMVGDIATDNGGSDFEWASKMEDRNKLWTARHKLFWACLGLKAGSRSVTTDVCVPISALPEVITSTREDIDKSGIIGNMTIAERRILVRTLPVDVAHCWAGGFLLKKFVIFKATITFLDSVGL